MIVVQPNTIQITVTEDGPQIELTFPGPQGPTGSGGGGGGSGDVVGPASATDNAVVRFDGTTGKLVQNSAVTIADLTGDITGGKFNGVAISGSSTPTLAVTGTSSISGSHSGTSSGTNTGDQTSVTGNAGTATALQTARTINGVSFDGTANITVAAAAGTLTGTTLASGVTASSLTSAAGGTFGTAAFTDASAYQISDAELTAIAGLVSAADRLPYFTGSGLASLATFTAAGRALVDDADAAAQRATLGLGTLATQSGTFSGTSSGTNTGDQTITLTGDATGSGTGSFVVTIANNAVSLAKMATLATDRILGRDTAGTGNVEPLTVGGGLEFTGSGGIQRSAITGDVTISAGATTSTIANSAVTLAKFQNISTASFLGRTSAGSGAPEILSTGAATQLIDVMVGDTGSGGTKGLCPAPSAGDAAAGKFLKADGTYQIPSGGGGGSVATDTIWDAAGDLAVGTGSNTASRLAAGEFGSSLMSCGPSTLPFYSTPNNTFIIAEHFISHLASTTYFTEVLSSVSSNSGLANDKDHPGVYSLSTGTSASSTGYLRAGNSSGTMMVGGGEIIFEILIKIDAISDGTQSYTIHIGFFEAPSGIVLTGNHHIKLIHDASTTNWQTSTKNNGTMSTVTTTNPVVLGWNKVRLRVAADRSSVQWWVNGVELSTSPITSNIPDAIDPMTFGFGISKQLGITPRLLHVDYLFVAQKLTNPS